MRDLRRIRSIARYGSVLGVPQNGTRDAVFEDSSDDSVGVTERAGATARMTECTLTHLAEERRTWV